MNSPALSGYCYASYGTASSETSDVIAHGLDYAFLRDEESNEFPEGGL
jgi:hypothetical protein